MTQQQESLAAKLSATIGGDWKATGESAALEGVAAEFPKFRSQAITSVLNGIAEDLGQDAQVVAMRTRASNLFAPQDPNSPREVIVPTKLAEDKAFAEALDASVRAEVTAQTSRLLSNAAQQGLAH